MNTRAPTLREREALQILAKEPLDSDSFEIEFYGTIERGYLPTHGAPTRRGRSVLGQLRKNGWVEGGPPELYRLTPLGHSELNECRKE